MTDKEAMMLAKKLEAFCYDKDGCYRCPFRIKSPALKCYICALDSKPNNWNLDFAAGGTGND